MDSSQDRHTRRRDAGSFAGVANRILQSIFLPLVGKAPDLLLNQGNGGNLSLMYEVGKPVGYGYDAGSTEPEQLSAMHLIVGRSLIPGKQIYVVTCYPIRPRGPQRRTFWLGRPKAFIPPDDPEKAKYPWLGQLAGAYLMQDFDIYAETLDEVLAYYVEQVGPEQSAHLRVNIARFLMERAVVDDAGLAKQYEEIFYPGDGLEGWDGKTTRQWLHRFHDVLSR